MGNYIDKILNYNIIDVNNCISINEHLFITKNFYNNPDIWDLKNKDSIIKIFKKYKNNFNQDFTNNVYLSIDKVIYYEIVNPIINKTINLKNTLGRNY